jgi:hypothetical protein
VSKLTAAAAAALLAPAAFSRGATGSSITSDRSLFDPTSSSLERQIMSLFWFSIIATRFFLVLIREAF